MSAYYLLNEKYGDQDWNENTMLHLCMEFIDNLGVEAAFDYFLYANSQENDDMPKADAVRCPHCGDINTSYKETVDRLDGTLVEFYSCNGCKKAFGGVVAVDEDEEEDIE